MPKTPDPLAKELQRIKRARKSVFKLKEDCSVGRHVKNMKDDTCRNCGAILCTHHMHTLRGCMLPASHSGSHYNAWSCDGVKWDDKDGIYVDSQENWVYLVNNLGQNRRN